MAKSKLLKKYFINLEDYKILNNEDFDINNFYADYRPTINKEDNRRIHNKQYITISPYCFKELRMHIRTSKSKEIKKY
jgi:hypothetical protein